MQKYIIKYTEGNCIEVSKPISTILLYRIPYQRIREKDWDIVISNRFIVYILLGKDDERKDAVYVGKSKNGIENRPQSHEDKHVHWKDCYILTDIRERTTLNDGMIQYLEHKISDRVDASKEYVNTTKSVNRDTASRSDMEVCNVFLSEAYDMLDILGLNLTEMKDEGEDIQPKKGHAITDSMKALFDKTDALIKETVPGIIAEEKAFYIKYSIEKNIICTIASTKTNLKLYINMKTELPDDPNNVLEDVSSIGHLGIGDWMCMYFDDRYFDDIRDFLKQAAAQYS